MTSTTEEGLEIEEDGGGGGVAARDVVGDFSPSASALTLGLTALPPSSSSSILNLTELLVLVLPRLGVLASAFLITAFGATGFGVVVDHTFFFSAGDFMEQDRLG